MNAVAQAVARQKIITTENSGFFDNLLTRDFLYLLRWGYCSPQVLYTKRLAEADKGGHVRTIRSPRHGIVKEAVACTYQKQAPLRIPRRDQVDFKIPFVQSERGHFAFLSVNVNYLESGGMEWRGINTKTWESGTFEGSKDWKEPWSIEMIIVAQTRPE